MWPRITLCHRIAIRVPETVARQHDTPSPSRCLARRLVENPILQFCTANSNTNRPFLRVSRQYRDSTSSLVEKPFDFFLEAKKRRVLFFPDFSLPWYFFQKGQRT